MIAISPGEFYEDYMYHPCLCISSEDGELSGVSLIDGTYPRSDHVIQGNIRKLSFEEALHWKFYGPPDVEGKYISWLAAMNCIPDSERARFRLPQEEIDDWVENA